MYALRSLISFLTEPTSHILQHTDLSLSQHIPTPCDLNRFPFICNI